jgi:hypothetical protein
VLEIGLGTNEKIVMAVLSTFPQSIQPTIPNSKVTTDLGLWKTDSGAPIWTRHGRSVRYPG